MKKLYTASLLVLIGCGESSEDSDNREMETVFAGVLNVDSNASDVIEVASTALNSVSEGAPFGALSADSTSPGTLTVNTSGTGSLKLLDGDGPSEENPNCSGNGVPYNADGTRAEAGDAGYILKKFYCLLNDKNSPDVVLGAIGIIRGFICMAERQEGFGYSVDGTQVEFDYDNVLTDEDAINCFPKAVLDSASEESSEDGGGGGMAYRGTITGYELAEGPWTHWIRIEEDAQTTTSEADEPMDTYFVVKDGKTAFKRGDISASLDFSAGELRFENLETTYGRHTRFLVKGELEDSGEFTTVDEMNGIHSQNFDFITVKGTTDTLFTYGTYSYECSDCYDSSANDGNGAVISTEGGEWSYGGGECLGEGDCLESNGLQLTDGDQAFGATTYTTLQTSTIDPWKESHGPLCFASVTADLVPDDTCNFFVE